MGFTMTRSTGARGVAVKRSRWKRRLVVVVAATIAPLIVYLVTLAVGADVDTPELPGQAAAPVSPVLIIADGIVAGLLGWALLAILERFTRKARVIWTVIAVVVFLLSLSGPMSGTGVT